MTVITQLYCQLYITCQLHVSVNTVFGHHQVGYKYRRKLHNIKYDIVLPSLLVCCPPQLTPTYLLTPWCRALLEKLTGLQLVKNFPHFTEPEGSLPQSQASATCLYPGPAQSSPPTLMVILCHITYCAVFSDNCIQPDDGLKVYWPKHVIDIIKI